MTLPRNRSTKYRKITRKGPKGPTSAYVGREKAGASCAVCKVPLAGVRVGSRTEKSVSRKFGGHLCHSCASRVIKEASRVREKAKTMDDVGLVYRKYVQQLAK